MTIVNEIAIVFFCRVPVDVLLSWQACFNTLLSHPDGRRLFEDYLKSEFSEENIQFWKACERFKMLPDHLIEVEAAAIYNEFIDPEASKLVSGHGYIIAKQNNCMFAWEPADPL